jgi:hypothetical protein
MTRLFRFAALTECTTIMLLLIEIVEAQTVYPNHNDTFNWNGYCVLNNQWGRLNATNPDWYQRTILENDSTVSFEYKWDGDQYAVKGMPVVMAGWHYGTLMGYRTPMGMYNLPSRVRENASFIVSEDVSHTNQGTYTEVMNLTWDVWFGSTENPNAPSHEMMVWPWYIRQIPNGSWLGRITKWGVGWDMYRGVATSGNDSWYCTSFLRVSNTMNTGGDLADFIDEMVSRGWIPGDVFVIGIEFGTELVRGQGSFHILEYSLIGSPPTGIQGEDNRITSSDFGLFQNYPNPFNPSTTIQYKLRKSSQVRLTIYDLLGQKTRTLEDAFQNAGEYSVTWNAMDERNNPVSSGMYFYRLEADDRMLQKKMLLIR